MQLGIHKNFELNGNSFSTIDELLNYSINISGSIVNFLSDFFSNDNKIKVQTSGSTGKPKLIEIKKEFMINSAIATGDFFDLKENTTALLCLSTDYIAGKMMLIRALVLGWKLDIVPPTMNPLKDLEKSYDFSAMVPLQVYNSIDDLAKIKMLIIGGGIVSNELKMKLKNISTKVYATYGMTETVTHIAVKSINNVELKVNNYKTLPNIKVSKDKRDCLLIDAPKVSDELVITNDLVELKSDTEFKWLGRYDSIINSGGIKLIPEQIEDKLSKIISQRFFIASLPDKKLGEKVILVIEDSLVRFDSAQRPLLNNQKSVILNEMKNLKTLNKYEVPKEIYFVSQFIETDTKKIQRKKTLDLVFFER